MNLVKLWLLIIISTQTSNIFKASSMPSDQQRQLDTELLDLCSKSTLTKSQLTNIKSLLFQGANPNVTDNYFGALHYAVLYNNIHLVKLLIEAGADLNAKSRWSQGTPLNIAIVNYHEEMGKLLLINNANPNTLDGFGLSSLDIVKRKQSEPFLSEKKLESLGRIAYLIEYYSLLNHNPEAIQNRNTLFGQVIMHAYDQFFKGNLELLKEILGISGNENDIPENVKMRARNFFNTGNPSILRLLETKKF